MDLTREEQEIHDWAIKYHSKKIANKVLSLKDASCDSYYICKTNHKYVIEYDFDTLPELIQYFSIEWDHKEEFNSIIKTVGIDTIKERSNKLEQKKVDQLDSEEEIPSYVYAF